MKGRLRDLTFGQNGEQHITVTVILADFREDFEKLKDGLVDIDIKKHRELRSRDANGYCWVLIGKIAECMSPPLSKEAVYQTMLRRYGQGTIVSVQSDRLQDVQREMDYWEIAGYGEIDGKAFTHLRFWVGSSKYNTKEMASFIDGIISECKELNIDTDTPEQIAQFKERWKNK